MTTEELALYFISHSDDEPSCIGLKDAERIISMIDKSVPLPPDLTPDSFMKEWNTLILFDLPDEVWEKWKKV